MLKLINIKQQTARKVTNYEGSYPDFLDLADKLNLALKPKLSNGSFYAADDSIDLTYNPNKSNPIRLIEWAEGY